MKVFGGFKLVDFVVILFVAIRTKLDPTLLNDC